MTPGTPDTAAPSGAIAELTRLRDALIQASVDADASPSGHRRSFLKACERSARRELEEAALNALPSLLASAEENARLRAALIDIACFDDTRASERLEKTGSYGGFDEPASVEIARAALGAPKTTDNGGCL